MSQSAILRLVSGFFLVNSTLFSLAGAFVPQVPVVTTVRVDRRLHRFETKSKSRNVDTEDDPNHVGCWKRRLAVTYGLALVGCPGIAVASDDSSADEPNLDALLDLPPVTNGCVRLFLCRHGQTENNRLRKVQGARIDPPINENGVQQAENLGKALGRLNPKPSTFFSSNLQRAKMTAEIAGSEVNVDIRVKQLGSLAEVDFGPVAEGQPVSLAKAGMQATYAAWAAGNIDFRPQGGEGESGREVLQRASSSLVDLARAGSESKDGTCVAVTHSTFLRILLALAPDVPLFEAAAYNIVNGGVSVIDVPRDLKTRRLESKARLFSGLWHQEIDLDIPVCHVIRINENRHLPKKQVLV